MDNISEEEIKSLRNYEAAVKRLTRRYDILRKLTREERAVLKDSLVAETIKLQKILVIRGLDKEVPIKEVPIKEVPIEVSEWI